MGEVGKLGKLKVREMTEQLKMNFGSCVTNHEPRANQLTNDE